MLELAWRSLLHRRLSVGLGVLSVALSILMLIGVERLREATHDGFENTVSGADLIVGARTGSVELLLYSVFRIGNATNNIGWDSYLALGRDPAVAWTIPLSLGDSHRGYPVLATTAAYFTRYQYGNHLPLRFFSGVPFAHAHDAVLGATVAHRLGYHLGDHIVLTHGSGEGAVYQHSDQPFTVTGILAATGTPVDNTVHISLEGMTAIHMGWANGSPSLLATTGILAQTDESAIPPPETITAFLVGLKSKAATFRYQRKVNQYGDEPLMAILPGVALSELWNLMHVAEEALRVISVFVIVIGLLGVLTALVTGLNERRREMAILRAIGLGAHSLFALMIGEALALVLAGIVCGMALLYGLQAGFQTTLQQTYGLSLPLAPPGAGEWLLLLATLVAGALIGVLPAWRAYRQSLHDGLEPH